MKEGSVNTITDPGVDDPQATNAAGWMASTYQYSATIPHAVTSIAIEGGGTNTYTYDANGNMTCRIENGVAYTHTYNAETCTEPVEVTAPPALQNAIPTALGRSLNPGRLPMTAMARA